MKSLKNIFLSSLLFSASALAQVSDPVLMTVNGKVGLNFVKQRGPVCLNLLVVLTAVYKLNGNVAGHQGVAVAFVRLGLRQFPEELDL